MEKVGTIALSVFGLLFWFSNGIFATGNFEDLSRKRLAISKNIEVVEGLPTPPVTVEEANMNSVRILIQRNPIALRDRQYGLGSLDIKEVEKLSCPVGMHFCWNLIEAEMSLQADEKRANALGKLLQIIVKDNYKDLMDYSEEFEKAYGVSMSEINYSGRNFLTLLLLFGGVEILRKFRGSFITADKDFARALTEVFKYIVENETFSHMATIIQAIPEILGIKTSENKLFFDYMAHAKNNSLSSNVALLFANLPKIKRNHIKSMLYLLPQSPNFVHDLIAFSRDIITTYQSYPNVFSDPRGCIFKFKEALLMALSTCIVNYGLVEPGIRFTIAALYIDFDNTKDLKKLLTESIEIFNVYPNGSTLLQIALDGGKYESAAVIAELAPSDQITLVLNGYQSPFAQLHQHPISPKVGNLYSIFLRKAEFTPTKVVTLYGDEADPTAHTEATAFTLAVACGRLDLLKILVAHFETNHLASLNLHRQIFYALEFVSRRFDAERASGKISPNIASLISQDIWAYFLEKEMPFSVDSDFTILDLAVINRCPAVVASVIEKYRAEVKQALTRASCLAYLQGEPVFFEIFNLLTEVGINYNSDHKFGPQNAPLIHHLLSINFDEQFQNQIIILLKTVSLNPTTKLNGLYYAQDNNSEKIRQFFTDLINAQSPASVPAEEYDLPEMNQFESSQLVDMSADGNAAEEKNVSEMDQSNEEEEEEEDDENDENDDDI